jgi:hypothetical protein
MFEGHITIYFISLAQTSCYLVKLLLISFIFCYSVLYELDPNCIVEFDP